MKVYLDNAATTKLHPKVLESMMPYLRENFGNPSSIHSFGRKSRVAIEDSREIIAKFINADPSEIYFMSCGTEANNFIINGIAKTEISESGRKNLITSAGDHKAVLSTVQNLKKNGFDNTILPIDKNFDVDLSVLNENIISRTSLASIVHTNNETGTIIDLESLSLRMKDVYIHTDAVQSFGKLKIDVEKLGIHALSASAHKLYGPIGIGIAYVRSGTPMESLLIGGGQERNRRAGTENVASIVGFAEAVKVAAENMDDNLKYVENLRNHFIEGLKSSGLNNIIPNYSKQYSPYILSLTFDPKNYINDSEAMIMFLDINGIGASSGSACASGTLKPSHVILSAGYSKEYANGTIRFSFSNSNTLEEVDYTIEVLKKLELKMRK